ncbi:hypothetical protein [Arthrobacter roseus]|uniref:hypothetical protein n=1 Tax=Arthrobacter roseus TaxID=136274 RepID=UPI0019645422|nr:hypothetical protein [Arthrobacter roseus]MBM7847056.1 hypothetical protein [Arthrobacter roseus]
MNRTSWLGNIAVASVLLAGCSAPTAETQSTSEAQHTMADGSVMSGAEHGDHSGVKADDGQQDADAASVAGPSDAARMICSGQVFTNIEGIFGLEAEPEPSSSWTKPVFTCTYDIEGAPLVLTVHDATDEAVGKKHFDELQASSPGAESLKGMFALDMPAFSTGEGEVAFLKDGKTLHVDATKLPGKLGPEGDVTQSDTAYSVAMAVLACWTDHT